MPKLLRHSLCFSLLTWVILPVVALADSLVILQYHHISTDTPPSTSLSPALFAEHMHYLEDNGFTVLPLDQALNDIQQGAALPDKAVALTFDDAYLSVYSAAYPLMKELDYPFTVFVTAGLVGDTAGLYTSWDQLREMGENGAILANHSMEHPYFLDHLSGETEAQWLDRIETEIINAEDLIEEKTGHRYGLLAYPYGEYNLQIQALVEELNMTAFGQQSGPVNSYSDFTALPRFPFSGIYASMNTFATRVSTLAFEITGIQPADRSNVTGSPEATLFFEADTHNLNQISCFYNSQPMTLEINGNSLTMSSEDGSRSRRFRYNCTAPAGNERYYWYSVDWVNASVQE